MAVPDHQLAAEIASFPAWEEAERSLEPEVRLRRIESMSAFFQPTRFQLRFASSLNELMRSLERAADMQRFHKTKLDICAELIPNQRSYRAILPRSGPTRDVSGTALFAMPGMGKTITTERVLTRFRQCVHRDGLAPRVAWLHLKASPPNLRLFCAEFLQSLSEVAEDPRIREVFLTQNASKDLLPAAVIELSKVHSLGCLVIDDLQNLMTAENGDLAKIRALLKRLQKEAGVSILLLGTPAGAAFVESELEAALAFSGTASDVWDRLEFDESWNRFLAALWPFQWTRTRTGLDNDISKHMYDRSQGVISLAIKLYQRVQKEAIRLSKQASDSRSDENLTEECITPELINAVGDWCFKPLHPHLDALRSRDIMKLSAFADLKPLRGEARRIDAQKQALLAANQAEQLEGEREQVEPVKTVIEAEELQDATDEQISEYKARVHAEADTLYNAARFAMSDAEIDDERQDEILRKVSEGLDDKIHLQPRKFLKEIERRIVIVERSRKKVRDRERRSLTDSDLDYILKPGTDVLSAIRKSGLGMDALFSLAS